MPVLQVIAYIRLCRPGSILGPQQIYLHEQQARMWQAGNHQGQPTSKSLAHNAPSTVPASLSASSRSRSVSCSQPRPVAPASQRVDAGAYSSKPPASMGAMPVGSAPASLPHPALAGLAALDSAPSSSSAQLQRFTSMPARSGAALGASSPTRSPSLLLSRRPDAKAVVGEHLLPSVIT